MSIGSIAVQVGGTVLLHLLRIVTRRNGSERRRHAKIRVSSRRETLIGQKDRTQKNEGAYLSAFDFSAIQLGSLQEGESNWSKTEEVNRYSRKMGRMFVHHTAIIRANR
jgi:hypothetical protein